MRQLNIVIPVFQRLVSIERLIKSIKNAEIHCTVNLTISCEYNSSADVLEYVNNLKWSFGDYEIITHPKKMGLDKHIFTCLRMCEHKGEILLLEDDLLVAPHFCDYLTEITANGIADQEQVLGLSIYRYPRVESHYFPFSIVPNDEFVYYQQRPSAKGCFYRWDKLKLFFQFLDGFNYEFENIHLPKNVITWNEGSWERIIYSYLIVANKYVAFPRESLSTDFADKGTHMQRATEKYAHQSNLFLSKNFGKLNLLENSINVFDQFNELVSNSVVQFDSSLASIDFEMDLYARKDPSKVKSEYMISSRISNKTERSWSRSLKPEVNNILLNIAGNFYSLAPTQSFTERKPESIVLENYLYHYPDVKLTTLLKMKILEVIRRFG